MPDRHSLNQFEADTTSPATPGRSVAIRYSGKQAGRMHADPAVARSNIDPTRKRHVRVVERKPRLQRMLKQMTMGAAVGAGE